MAWCEKIARNQATNDTITPTIISAGIAITKHLSISQDLTANGRGCFLVYSSTQKRQQ